jgi:hypothetical protein
MKKTILLFVLFLGFTQTIFAQSKYLEFGLGLGSGSVSPVLGLHKDFNLGKKDKFIIGTGIRYTGYFGKDIYLSSAPNDLAIEPSKTDSLLAPSPSIHALNIPINLGYKLSNKIAIGFNIDLLGVSFGPKGNPKFIAAGKQSSTEAKPTPVNILLVGNNDRGSLNSMFYGNYKITEKFGLKLAYQFLFNELTTSTKVQTSPVANDRFRVKSGMIFIGAHVNF